jgi:hypothetical protein
MSAPVNLEAVGLRPREMQVLQAAAWARTQVPNGHYLCSTGQNRAAERLIAKGFLTKADADFSPPMPDWLVVVLTNENYAALRAAENAPLPPPDGAKDDPAAAQRAHLHDAERIPDSPLAFPDQSGPSNGEEA